ncbi:MAG: hypothetical protein V4673_02750 [Pseudomonadota bacterium]
MAVLWRSWKSCWQAEGRMVLKALTIRWWDTFTVAMTTPIALLND